VANWAKGAKVVKIFNTTGFNNMLELRYREHRTFMPYCSDHADAKKIAHGLAAQIGFDPVDCGPLAEARLLEPMALVWIHLAIRNQNRDIAFHLLRRSG
jgi:8-hydroxy-5-deazaflavin:NADPH oxidoreductase